MKILPLLSVLSVTTSALGQTVSTPAIATTPSAPPIELNPFVITAGVDDGYAPSETLSGTRLKASVKDVASAISIISADMLADLGALDFNDVLDFLPSTARYQSNEGDLDNNGQRTGNPYTVRGFRSDSLTTNFFTAMTPIDSYNTSRLTFTRGPNSILFGVGNPGGGLDIVTNRPDLTKNSHALSLRVDSFDSYRAALDSSVVLIPGKLGLRLDLLQEDRRRYVTPTKKERTSAFLAATYRPFPATTLTLNGESSRIRQTVGRSVVGYDHYTPWVSAGSPLKPVYGNTTATNGLEYNNANGYLVVVEGQSAIAPMNWRSSAYGARQRVAGAINNRVSFNRAVVVPLNRNLGGDGDAADIDAHNVSLFLQQAVGRKLFFEVAGKFEHQFLYNFEGMSGTDNTVRVDGNAQLPNGQPNPMAGQPYVETSAAFWVTRPTDNAQGRVTASYEIDLNRHRVFQRRLGTLSFGALYNYERLHQLLDNAREVNVTPLLTTGTFGRPDNAVNNIRRRTYLVPGGSGHFVSNWAPINSGGIRSGFERVRATPRDNISETKALVYSAQADLFENFLVGTFGIRHDRVLQEQGVYERDARGVFPELRNSSGTLATNDRGRTYSQGVVINATKAVSVFANRATNFVPSNQSVVNIDGAPASPIEGEGYDVGLKFRLLGGKLQGSIDRFSTTQQNVTDNTLSGQKRAAINAIWDALDLNRVPNPQWGEFKSTRTTGYEFQLVGNPTSNLRLMVTASKNITTIADRGARLFAYIARHLPEWQAKSATPVNSTLGATVGQLATLIANEAANDKLTIGIRQTRSAEWQFSGVARYKFDAATRWKGFAVGSAFTWRDEPVIGYKLRPGTALFDITQPFFGAKTLNVDAWVDYARVIGQKRIRWETQLRAQNVLNTRTAAPWTAVDDGTGGRFVEQRLLPNALGVSLSSTFRF
ncbi:MAG: TonB-dependent receptor plug domain-containing protein [Opitutaceae bacterium]|nr:TonB-dependent receptor plug domain-containing protein [Opitutaceae bacterium]